MVLHGKVTKHIGSERRDDVWAGFYDLEREGERRVKGSDF